MSASTYYLNDLTLEKIYDSNNKGIVINDSQIMQKYQSLVSVSSTKVAGSYSKTCNLPFRVKNVEVYESPGYSLVDAETNSDALIISKTCLKGAVDIATIEVARFDWGDRLTVKLNNTLSYCAFKLKFITEEDITLDGSVSVTGNLQVGNALTVAKNSDGYMYLTVTDGKLNLNNKTEKYSVASFSGATEIQLKKAGIKITTSLDLPKKADSTLLDVENYTFGWGTYYFCISKTEVLLEGLYSRTSDDNFFCENIVLTRDSSSRFTGKIEYDVEKNQWRIYHSTSTVVDKNYTVEIIPYYTFKLKLL